MSFPLPSGKTALAPSILSADIWRLGEQVTAVQNAGADWLHLDIMDGHFVPNLTFGPAVCKSLKGKTALPLDLHLMVEYPSKFILPFFKAGADNITVHIESKDDTYAVLKQIKDLGLCCGVSIKPHTDAAKIKPYLDIIDLILVMTVEPGFAGQSYIPAGEKNITAARRLIKESGRKIWLEVDGGINAQTAPRAVKAGADALVAGYAVFGAETGIETAIKDFKKII
ncbi:MAG: ribulose-phosphate 3-epimerase [Elusimicrobia bacterium]|nr:ribulose-phosphate 3-epimerase [Elusimicrobiota bacterium]